MFKSNNDLETNKEVLIYGAHGWYDFTVQVKGYPEFTRRFAGRVETGRESVTDPVMGNIQGRK